MCGHSAALVDAAAEEPAVCLSVCLALWRRKASALPASHASDIPRSYCECRLAFVAALGAELSTGESVFRQLADEPTGVILAVITFITASLIPLLNSTKREAVGPFTPKVSVRGETARSVGRVCGGSDMCGALHTSCMRTHLPYKPHAACRLRCSTDVPP